MIIKNPIIRGSSPDPTVCKQGEYYYLCNSTFSFFPGLPIYRSRDLCNWEQIGNAIDRPSQLDFGDCRFNGAVYAPTMRYHKGKFYIINCFHCCDEGGYYITADDPAGPWSDPIFCLGGYGDPELFFDDDGRVYYIAVRGDSMGKLYPQDGEVFGREFDLENNCFVGEPFRIWEGALVRSENLEGPHMYKKDGYYYIMAAEGGTGEQHSVVIARSRDIRGPYEPCPHNPILTHRHFGGIAPFYCTGHGDMFEGFDGRWYMVLLGSRKYEGYTFMGRETLFAKVDWIDGWPYVNRGYGMITEETELEGIEYPVAKLPEKEIFDGKPLGYHWLRLRGNEPPYEMTDGGLVLYTRPERLGEKVTPSFIAQRQREFFFTAQTEFTFAPLSDECAGMAYIRTDERSIRFEVGGDKRLRVVEMGDTVYRGDEMTSTVTLRMIAEGLEMYYEYKKDGETDFTRLPIVSDLRNYTNEAEITFVGNLFGMYTSSNGNPSDNKAVFKYFIHKKGASCPTQKRSLV